MFAWSRSDAGSKVGPRSVATIGLAITFGLLCAWPYARWFASPSLFDDDFLRVGSLRRSSLGDSLFRPFNEHMAPLFETVSWLAWVASGRSVLAIPLGFQVSSYLAFGSTVALLGAVAWSELRSRTATMICVALFALSAVSAETVLWFSASSFEWSAAATLLAWWGAIKAVGSARPGQRLGWLALSSLACLAAPAFSAIGILAGPLASLRILTTVDRSLKVGPRLARSLAPIAGTILYLTICHYFAYGEIVAASLHDHLALSTALWATIRAPAAVLLPGLLGQGSVIRQAPGEVLAGLTSAGILGAVVVASRSPRRSIILGGLALILGGYLATYATRARPGDTSLFEIQRYHLFPQLGLSLLLAALARSCLGRFDRDLTKSLAVVVLATGLLAIAQYPRMQDASDRNYRFPDQPRTIAAILKLEATCDRDGMTLIQAMAALDPVQARWFPRRGSFHPLFHLFARGVTVPRVADEEVRARLIDSLTMADREAIFGGLEANRYRWDNESGQGGDSGAVAVLVASQRLDSLGPDRYRASGPGSWVEFAVEDSGSARGLLLPGLRSRNPVEIWWSGPDGVWSPDRSVRWTTDQAPPEVTPGIALDRLPHWRTGFTRRLRLIFREWGPVGIGTPRLVP